MPSFLSDIFVVQRFKICVAHFPEAPVAKLLPPCVQRIKTRVLSRNASEEGIPLSSSVSRIK